MTSTRARDRRFDIVLFGVTGFTGRLVAEYLLASRSDADLRLAFAGRNVGKVEEVRRALGERHPSAGKIPILRADSFDRPSLDAIARDAAVVCTTVGPYLKYGAELVAACVQHGTDYCDLTGEVAFMRQSIDRHHEEAQRSGARIVHACGFDSIPSDLGTLMLSQAVRSRYAGRLREVEVLVKGMRGGFSGGTVSSMLETIDAMKRDPSLRKLFGNPYSLNPNGDRGNARERDLTGPKRDPRSNRWRAPFVMASVNTRVVRRSQALLGHPNGSDFRYFEAMEMGRGLKGAVAATAATGALGGFLLAASIRPTRALLERRVLPAPGEGPSDEQRARGFFRFQVVGRGVTDRGREVELRGKVGDDRDPGYGSTSKMLGEAALCLARDAAAEGTLRAGVLTPATALGGALLERLRRAGMTFEVEGLEG